MVLASRSVLFALEKSGERKDGLIIVAGGGGGGGGFGNGGKEAFKRN